MTDFRELCSELLQALDEIAEYKVVDLDWIKSKPLKMASESMRDARAALDAAPEGEAMQRLLGAPIDARWYADLRRPAAPLEWEPSDEELRDLWSWSSGQDQGPWPTQYHCFARAVLSRWGRPATPPAPLEGEVGELVAWLRENAEDERLMCESVNRASLNLDRTAALLEQLSAAAPAVHPKEENREFVFKEMTAEDGSSLGWYINHSDFYCDIQKEDGVWGVYFRDKITDQDAYGEPNET